MKKIILTDADGVLVTWLAGFEKFMESKGYEVRPDTNHIYSMAERYNITPDESFEMVRQYNESPFIRDLPPHIDSVEYVTKLAEHGFKFICISSISSHPNALKHRTENLENVYGDIFQEIHCLEMGAYKKPALTNWEGTGLFWIEDHINNAIAGHDLGLKSVLIQHDYNNYFETEDFPIVGPDEPWKKIYELVCKEYNISTQ